MRAEHLISHLSTSPCLWREKSPSKPIRAESALAKAEHKGRSVADGAPVQSFYREIQFQKPAPGFSVEARICTPSARRRLVGGVRTDKTGPAAFMKHETRLAARPSGRRRGPGSGAATPLPPSPPPRPFPLQPAPSRRASASSRHSHRVASAFASKVFSKRCRAPGW